MNSYLHYLPGGTNVHFVAQKVGDSTPLVQYNEQEMSLPASTQKIITALAATLLLGNDYRFKTTFSSHAIIKNNQLNGDLIIRFTGDPLFSRQQLKHMINQLKLKGLTKINGNLLIDSSAFASHDKAPGWSWNDLTQCFSAPPSAVIIDRNCFSVSLYSANKIGETAFIRVPSYYPVTVFSQVITLDKKDRNLLYCELDVVPGEFNRYTITGCLPQRAEPLPLTFAVQNGASYAANIIKQELTQANITLSGKVKHQIYPQNNGTILVEQQSLPLSALLKIMLKKSDNMIADTLFRTIGGEYFNTQGTWRTGSNAIKQILKKKANIDLGNTIIVDGSGLSRYNLISPVKMMMVLQYIAKNDQQLNLIEKLPLAGYDGTLQYRPGLYNAGVNKKVQAKTGSLQGVYNLAGYITTAKGEKLAFVQFVSHYSPPSMDNKQRRLPLARFETHLYKDLYSNN